MGRLQQRWRPLIGRGQRLNLPSALNFFSSWFSSSCGCLLTLFSCDQTFEYIFLYFFFRLDSFGTIGLHYAAALSRNSLDSFRIASSPCIHNLGLSLTRLLLSLIFRQ